MYKVGIISLGCPKNQVDAELMLAALEAGGFELVDFYDGADAVIVNTCGFIDDAKKEAVENILDVTQLKEEGVVGSVIVTGCLSQRYGEELLAEIPEVDAVLGIGANGEIARLVKAVIEKRLTEKCVLPPREELPLSGARTLTTPEYWAYLKIADGCSNRCAYCAIPSIRGTYRSRPQEDIVAEARTLAMGGVKELILVAQDTTAYGIDLYGELRLPELLKELAAIEEVHWIRLLYCYPDTVTRELIDVLASEDKVVKYIDLPLQHADDGILAAMNRRGTAEEYRALIGRLREAVEGIAIRTTVMLGFPGEGEEEFEALAEFVNELEFDRLGCFAFSAQEGTPAAELDDALDDREKERRCEVILRDQDSIVEVKNNARLGKTYEVLVEGYDEYTDTYSGRTYMDAPEIDGKVLFTCPRVLNDGDFVNVEIRGISDYDLLGSAE